MRYLTIFLMLAFCLVLYSDEGLAREERELGFHGVGVQMGYVSPEDLGGTVSIGVNADAGEPFPGFLLVPGITYWKVTKDGFKTREFGLGADMKYFFSQEAVASPYFGAGLGLYFTEVGLENPTPYASVEKGSNLGLSVIGGYEHMVSDNVIAFAEARYRVNGIDSFGVAFGFTALLDY